MTVPDGISSIRAAEIIGSIRPTDRVHSESEADSVTVQFGHKGFEYELGIRLDSGNLSLLCEGEEIYSN